MQKQSSIRSTPFTSKESLQSRLATKLGDLAADLIAQQGRSWFPIQSCSKYISDVQISVKASNVGLHRCNDRRVLFVPAHHTPKSAEKFSMAKMDFSSRTWQTA